MSNFPDNPFAVQKPEDTTVDYMMDFFVEEFSDYLQIEKSGHTMAFGPRGTGKSTIFRYMEPDCQLKLIQEGDANPQISMCKYFAVSIPLKSTKLNLPEFDRIMQFDHGHEIIREHALVSEVLGRLIFSLKERIPSEHYSEIRDHELEHKDDIRDALLHIPENFYRRIDELSSVGEFIDLLKEFHDLLRRENKIYRDKLVTDQTLLSYEGSIVGYSDFLKPLISVFRKFSWTPNAPIYLLFDDSDELGITQTKILNSWIAQRSTGEICIKVAAQEGKYKTFQTLSNMRIETPHDYSHYSVDTIYTAGDSKYKKQVKEILKKRFKVYGINSTPEEFFPEKKEQVERISEIADELRTGEIRGFRPEDDVYRYARPNYFRELSGASKNLSNYSYSGLNQLINLSDGLLRDFLEAASMMYAETKRAKPNGNVSRIPPSVQNDVVRKYSGAFIGDEYSKALSDEKLERDGSLSDMEKLYNLILSMGGMFHQILISDQSERRVFSVAVTSGPEQEIEEVLELGIKHRYFKKTTIGNKEGTGRVPQYILSRRLAPYFKLDPNGFSGYKFLTNRVMREALNNHVKFTNFVKTQLNKDPKSEFLGDDKQGDFFDDV